jgi:hypothetical protein
MNNKVVKYQRHVTWVSEKITISRCYISERSIRGNVRD